MGDVGEMYKAMRMSGKDKKKSNLQRSTELLKEKNVCFEVMKNGLHYVVKSSDGLIDFWPSTGKFIVRKTNRKDRGVFNLLKLCNQGCGK